MGKPYDSELQQLPTVYRWALEQNIDSLVSTIAALGAHELQVIGSGGSLTLAFLMSYFHQLFFKRLARPLTPLNAIQTPTLKSTAVFIFSAGGKNQDIIRTFKHLAQQEPTELGILCNRDASPLTEMAKGFEYVRAHEFEPPSGKDGFVATNTLLTTAVLLARAYTSLFPSNPRLPYLEALFGGSVAYTKFFAEMEQEATDIFENDFFLVLHSACTEPAAWDLESKFSEAALGAVQLTDYRNFAHGRHHWIDRYGARTSVVALINTEDHEIAEKTLNLLPTDVPKLRIVLKGSEVTTAISAMIAVLFLVKFAGQVKHIDPGRPKVPEFGRKLYNMTDLARENHANVRGHISPISAAAIKRKSRSSLEHLSETEFKYWLSAYRRFLEVLSDARFQAVIFDYDGTLCESGRRFIGVRQEVTDQLYRILEANVVVGIATGRGKSVREDFRKIVENRHWESVYIGYYNCGQIGNLNEDSIPDVTVPYLPQLNQLFDFLSNDPQLKNKTTSIEIRPQQISIVPCPWEVDVVFRELIDVAYLNNFKIVRSTHSIDILPSSISKNLIVTHIRNVRNDISSSFLRIGDLGTWPGNDFELLADPYGLSVHETSADPRTCWNLSKPGHRGVQATIDYIEALIASQNGFYFDLKKSGISKSI